jgi:hypothetical protein
MAIKDVLLPLFGNPSSAMIAATTKCVDVVASFGAEITALAVEEMSLFGRRSWSRPTGNPLMR